MKPKDAAEDIRQLAEAHAESYEKRTPQGGTTGRRVQYIEDRACRDGWIVGYSWTRPYSHHMGGRVTDQTLGNASTREGAIEKARQTVARRLAKLTPTP